MNKAEVARARAIGGFALKAILGAGLLYFLMTRIDSAVLLATIRRERLSFFAATVLLYVSGQALCALRWWLLARALELPVRFGTCLRYYFIGVFTNLFVPGLVGGDAARIFYLGSETRKVPEAAASVAADRLVGLIALVLFAAGSAAALGRGVLPKSVIGPIVAVGAATLVGCLFIPMLPKLVDYLPARLAIYARRITVLLDRPRVLSTALLFSLILHASQVVCQYLLAVGLGLDISFKLLLLCVPTTNFLAATPITLNGLGVREGAYLFLLGMAGVSRSDAIALGLLWFASAAVGGLFGIPAFIWTPIPRPVEGPAQGNVAKAAEA